MLAQKIFFEKQFLLCGVYVLTKPSWQNFFVTIFVLCAACSDSSEPDEFTVTPSVASYVIADPADAQTVVAEMNCPPSLAQCGVSI